MGVGSSSGTASEPGRRTGAVRSFGEGPRMIKSLIRSQSVLMGKLASLTSPEVYFRSPRGTFFAQQRNRWHPKEEWPDGQQRQ